MKCPEGYIANRRERTAGTLATRVCAFTGKGEKTVRPIAENVGLDGMKMNE
jgi:hypothetical protein